MGNIQNNSYQIILSYPILIITSEKYDFQLISIDEILTILIR